MICLARSELTPTAKNYISPLVVAQVEKGRGLSGPQEYFCRLVAFEGLKQTAAYRRAFKCAQSSAPELSSRLMGKSYIVARIAEMRAQADREGAMAMGERRRLLADVARKGVKAKASAGDAIAAIREDAILAGERRTDGTQVSIAGDVNLTLVLQSLRNGSTELNSRSVGPIDDLPASGARDGAPSSGDVETSDTAAAPMPGGVNPSALTNGPSGAILGPLGRVGRAVRVQAAPSAIASPAAPFAAED